ncbi:hypothetical protein [Ralstonia insidiosa]|uniref:Uncharacterized protein n=1 Tax=Ralstonia insidiosa TaxID=190721 RepID=A0A848P4S5_9RALS|nr:hypothetical protein [Ralstonia insidiosa]NMV40315.1 hypothetical protein [Ralstonia insidiosa]
MHIRAGFVLLVALIVSGCGGNDSGDSGSGGATPASITTTVGNASVTKTFQPGVVQLDTGAAVAVDDTTLRVPAPPSSLRVGSVITWNDRAYVVVSTVPAQAGGLQLTVRPAQFSEVLVDLSVTGDLDMSNLDISRMAIKSADGTSATPQSLANTPTNTPGATLRPTSTPFTAGPCTGDIGDRKKGESSSASCAMKFNYADFQFAVNVGMRDAVFSGLNISFLNASFSVANLSVTPFVRATASLLDDQKQTINLSKDDIPLVYLQVPFEQTLGFLRVDMPARLDVSLPLFKFQAGAEVSFPYSNGSWTMNASIDTPVATLGTDTLFKYDASGHVYGVVGAELVLGKTPVLVADYYAFQANSPDRLLSAGAFFKGGWDGSLSVNVATLQSKPCFKWNLQGKGAVAS